MSETTGPVTDPSTAGSSESVALDFASILKVLPHRYPFLFVDGVTSLLPGQTIEAFKNVSFNDNFFQGHFPQEPVMPGVIQVEALAQACCILMALSFPNEYTGKRPVLAGIEECRFRKPVRPGDKLVLKAKLESLRRGFATCKASAEVDGKVVVDCLIKATFV